MSDVPQQTAFELSLMLEALPYIRRLKGRVVVIKYGGNAMADAPQEDSFARDIVLLKTLGVHPLVVHGGGPQISQMLQRLGKTSTFVEGLRVTDAATMEVVQMVLGGVINKAIVDRINHHGGQAVGLTGKDGGLVGARKLWLKRTSTAASRAGGDNATGARLETDDRTGGGEVIDLGYVGEVESINPRIISVLTDNGFIPVIAPLATGADNQSYNINSDVMAAKIAAALKADTLLLLTNTAGLLDHTGQLITSISTAKIKALIESGTICGGMLPKVRYAMEAVAHGVNNAVIADGRVAHAVVLQLLTARGTGTAIENPAPH